MPYLHELHTFGHATTNTESATRCNHILLTTDKTFPLKILNQLSMTTSFCLTCRQYMHKLKEREAAWQAYDNAEKMDAVQAKWSEVGRQYMTARRAVANERAKALKTLNIVESAGEKMAKKGEKKVTFAEVAETADRVRFPVVDTYRDRLAYTKTSGFYVPGWTAGGRELLDTSGCYDENWPGGDEEVEI